MATIKQSSSSTKSAIIKTWDFRGSRTALKANILTSKERANKDSNRCLDCLCDGGRHTDAKVCVNKFIYTSVEFHGEDEHLLWSELTDLWRCSMALHISSLDTSR